MTTDIFGFYLQNRLIQTGQTGGQQYSDTPPFSIPWLQVRSQINVAPFPPFFFLFVFRRKKNFFFVSFVLNV